MIARRKLRDNAAVRLVHRHLRVQRVREQPALRVIYREAGFVAGRFDSEDKHGVEGEASRERDACQDFH